MIGQRASTRARPYQPVFPDLMQENLGIYRDPTAHPDLSQGVEPSAGELPRPDRRTVLEVDAVSGIGAGACTEGELRVNLAEGWGEVVDDSPYIYQMIGGEQVAVGNPVVEGASVEVTVVEHGRHPKILGFKYKRRKGYRRSWGHKQPYTVLKIDQIKN